ncbi:MAG: hypothetical protein ABIR10_14730 [Dokdonella sp.]
MRNPTANTERSRAGAWQRQPVLWLGLAIFVASLAGCVWMIVLGARHADTPLPIAGGEIMRMPVARAQIAPPDPSNAAQ